MEHILEIPLHKPYFADFIRKEFNTTKDSLVILNRSNPIGRYIYSISKPFASDKRREATNYVHFLLPRKTSIRFTKRYNYLSYEGEQMINDYISSMYDLRINSIVITAHKMKLPKKEAIYAYLFGEGLSANAMNFDQIVKSTYRFEKQTKKALSKLVFEMASKKFGTR